MPVHPLLFATRSVALLCTGFIIGCAADISDDINETDTDIPPKLTLQDGMATLDASDKENFVYIHLGTESEVVPATPEDSTDWDLAFKRYTILINGGISGTGEMEALAVSDLTWEELDQAPTGEYVTDADDMDGDGAQELALKDWYSYDPVSHNLTALDVIYALRATDGQYYKFRALDYYDSAGSPAILTLEWAPITGP